jgi:2-polyprenyl-6-methoxyphenol hydroxylase-like FAD-dependent oxidoreductase
MNRTVVIAGGGPTGLMLAAELGLAGVQSIVLDPAAGPRQESPSMAINTSTVELLSQRGLMDQLRKNSLILPRAHYALMWLDVASLKDQHEYSIVIDQSYVEEMLRKRAIELGADIRFCHEVVSLSQDETGVVVGVRSAAGEYEISGQYLAGCDGGNSMVRRLAGIGFPGTDPTFYGIAGDVKVDISDLVEGQIGAFTYPTGGVYTGGPLKPGTLRVVTAEFGVESPHSDEPVALDELLRQVHRLTGTVLKATEACWLTRYGNPTRNAECYRSGRIFLVGDAAHIFFPLGGLRLNACIQDAMNLGWKLAADVQGWAPPGLLDTYHRERHPVGQQLCTAAAAQVALLRTSEGVAELREIFGKLLQFDDVNQYLLELVTGLDVRYPMEYGGSRTGTAAQPLLGRRLSLCSLNAEHEQASVARALSAGRGVLIDLSGGLANVADARGWQDRVDVVTAESAKAIEATTVLIRPDGNVAWAGPAAAGDGGLRLALTTRFGAETGAP